MSTVKTTIWRPDTCKCVIQLTFTDGVQTSAVAITACDEHGLLETLIAAASGAISKNRIKNGFVT